ncbi:MAG: tRNA ((37)-N6)-threonylcarbamoyltransferase complex dimerization subunit type 1 TsaB [Pseudomonadota bacterium]
MRTLAIETAGAACSIALIDGDVLVAERHEIVGRGHAERLIPWIAGLPDGGHAGQIVVGCGPGSFTGVRIGVAAARGLGLGWNVPVFGVSSLALLAIGCEADFFTVAVEGGHGELFVQNYQRRPFTQTSQVQSLTPGAAAAIALPLVIGSGAHRVVDARGSGEARDAVASASAVNSIPAALYLIPVRPIYGRSADAKLPA